MPAIVIGSATRVVGEALVDIYSLGKSAFSTSIAKWRNNEAHQKLARKIAKTEKVKTFWQRDKPVSISTFYFPSRVSYDDGPPQPIDSLAALSQGENYVIEGTVGQGKSIFLRHLCVQELTAKGSKRIPVFVELRTVTASGLRASLKSALENLGFMISEELFDFYLGTGRLVILLDAFDELEETLIKPVLNELETIAERHEETQIIVTSRPKSAIHSSRHFRTIRLSPLSPTDHEGFLKRLGLKAVEIKQLIEATQRGGGKVHELITTPLMLTLLVVVYRTESAIPSEVPEFFQKLFETLFSKHDGTKPAFVRKHKTKLGERKLQFLFEAFCFSAMEKRLPTSLSTDQFDKAFSHATQLSAIDCDTESFRHDIVRVTCLMQEEGYLFHFLHKSVLEFFCASFVARGNDRLASRFYDALLKVNTVRWSQVINFLAQIDRYRFLKYYELPCLDATLELVGDTSTHRLALESARRAFEGVEVRFVTRNGVRYIQALAGLTLFGVRHQDVLARVLLDVFSGRWTTTTELTRQSIRHDETKSLPWEDFADEKELTALTAGYQEKAHYLRTRRLQCAAELEEEDRRADLLNLFVDSH